MGDSELKPLKQLNQPNRADGLNIVRGDLALSDSEDESDNDVRIMANHLARHLLEPSTRSIEVNTDSVRVHTADKDEPLIILCPDELIEFSDGLTIASFDKSLRIFAETLNSKIVMAKSNLETPPDPTTQIGLLKVQLKANQTKLPHTDQENEQLIEICSTKPTRPLMFVPEAKMNLIREKILNMPGCSKSKDL